MADHKPPHQPGVSVLDAMTGRKLPGGCDDCDAFQVMSRHADGLYTLAVHHDDSCPTFREVHDA